MIADARFLYVICQVGAETPLKNEVAHAWPTFRLAFSRPGFVTFKLPAGMRLADDFDLGCILARTSGFSLGKVSASDAETAARKGWELAHDESFAALHVWQRDSALPGDREFEPGITPLAEEVGQILVAARPSPQPNDPLPVNQNAKLGDRVLDCVVVEPNEWWLGWHLATGPVSCWPGGVPRLEHRDDAVSRAYYKMQEALDWSRLPMRSGDRCVEIGSAPGGAAQALLERDLVVLGIDPAEMHESVLKNPRFQHLRSKVAMVKRREFRSVKWLFVDSNIAPRNALDDVEAIVTHGDVNVRGLVMTLKLSDWSTLDSVPQFVERVRGWGFEDILTRQLAFNRREFCLAALRRSRPQRD